MSIYVPAPHSCADLKLLAEEFSNAGFECVEDLLGADPAFIDEIHTFDGRIKALARTVVDLANGNILPCA